MSPSHNEPKQVYLIHGNSETDVNNARFELVSSLLTPEERDSGLTEVRAASNQPLTLDRALNEIIGELGTSSFIPGSKRVVVIHDLKELFDASRPSKSAAKAKPAKEAKGAKGPAPDRMTYLVDWLRTVLPTTENIAVFVCQESDEKGRTIATEGPLYQLARQVGTVVERREKPLNFDFEDKLLSGNTAGALLVLTEWVDRAASDSGSRLKIYTTVAGLVEVLLQAVCLDSARRNEIPGSQATVTDGFPTLGRLPSFKAKKVEALARRLSPDSLREMLNLLDQIQAAMYPTGEEDHVPDWVPLLETVVIRLTALRD